MRRTNPDSLRSCLCFRVFRLKKAFGPLNSFWSNCKDNEERGNRGITEIAGQCFVFFVDYSNSCVAWSGAAYVDK